MCNKKISIRMRPVLMTLAFFLVLPQVQAQRGNMDKATWVETTLTAMTKAVDLTEEQAELVKPIISSQFDKQSEAREAMRGGGDRASMRATMDTLRKETDEKIIALLDESQVEKYKTYAAQAAQRGRRRGGRVQIEL